MTIKNVTSIFGNPCTYLEVWRQEVFEEPKFDGILCMFENTQHHDSVCGKMIYTIQYSGTNIMGYTRVAYRLKVGLYVLIKLIN